MNKLTENKWWLFSVWMLFQTIMLLIFQDSEQFKDTIGAEQNALYCCENGVLSPNENDLYAKWIQAPGFINWLAMLYSIFGTFMAAQWANLLMNGIIMLEVYYIAKLFCSKRVALISCVMYGVILTNVFASVMILSEVPFLCLSLTGFVLSLQKRWWNLLGAGVLYAVAYTFKPLVLAFVITSAAFYLLSNKSWKRCLVCLVPFVICLQIIAGWNAHRIGYPVTSSTTGGYNLAMSVNSPKPCHSERKNRCHPLYIEGCEEMTFVQKDSAWKKQAINYIIENPIQYVKACAKKPFWLFYMDSWSIPPLVGYDSWTYAANAADPKRAHRIVHLLRSIWSIPYYIVLLLFISALIKYRREILTSKGYLLLIALLGLGATSIFTVEERYHYPYMFVMAIWGAMVVEDFLKRHVSSLLSVDSKNTLKSNVKP